MFADRKKILIFLVGAIVLWFVGGWVYDNLFVAPIENQQKKKELYLSRIKEYKRDILKIKNEAKILEELNRRCLPSDTAVARSLYQGWLLELVNHVGLVDPKVNSSEPASRSKGKYHLLTFSVNGRGTLNQLIQFLFEFYRAGHLHQIRSIGLTPLSGGSLFSYTFRIEAISLPGADRKDRLTDLTSARLVSDNLDEYRAIVERDFFATGADTAADQVIFSSVIDVDGQKEVWLRSQADDRTIKIHQGETFEAGTMQGRLIEINGSDIIIESNGFRWLLTLGDPLSAAVLLPAEY
jgi:hypothetical protein